MCATRLKTRFNDPFKSLPTGAARFGLHDVYASSDIIFKDTRTHTCKSSGHFRAQEGEAGSSGRVSGSSAHLLPLDCIQYAPLRYEHTYATRAHTGVHIGCPPSIEPSTPPSDEVVERITYQAKIKCKHPEFDQNSLALGEQVETL